MIYKHARIIQYPFTAALQGALLDSYHEEKRDDRLDIILNIRAFECTTPAALCERDQIIHERIEGNYVPARLHFSGISELKSSDFYRNITNLSRNDLTRTIEDVLSWRPPGKKDVFFLFFMQIPDTLMFFARQVRYEKFSQTSNPVLLERSWSPAPPMPGRLVPQPKQLHSQFGGDPITIKLNDKVTHRKLFIGGLEIQSNQRPQVDAVLNLGEKASRWVSSSSRDRSINKGEDSQGMSSSEIREEAEWVIDRLQRGQRVLVHCVAGMNRSATICCAVLMLLEGLSAEAALARVREHHPWARPDSHHWLALRWLEITSKGKTYGS